MKKILSFIYMFISFIYLELLFKILVTHNYSMLLIIFFSLILASIFTIIFRLFNHKINKLFHIIFYLIIGIWFSAQFVCKDYFGFYISWELFEVADQMNDFLSKCVIETLKRTIYIILFLLPFILSIILRKKIDYKRYNFKNILFFIIISIISTFIYLGLLRINKSDVYSNYNLYYKINNVNLNMENFGIINTLYIDTKRKVQGFEEDIIINNVIKEKEKEEIIKEYGYNNLDIDFDKMNINNNISKINEYVKSDTGSLKNDYTGYFKDKNLILFMGESFNEVAVDKDMTPTLYKLVNNGFVFNNFYTPTIYSTIGGEFQELTGLYASSVANLKLFRNGGLSFPYGIGNVFKNSGYKTYAYHNNSYVFQDRNKYLKSLGFDNFKGCYNGMEKLINCKVWPQSDLDMINATYTDFINDDKFMVYYVTVSGHSGYSFSYNANARKHKDEALAFNKGYSEGIYSYIAANMELDKALESLINKLEENGKLDDTIIALVGDHYPYELSIDEINEASSYTKDDIIEVNRSNFILWNNKMDNVSVDKVGSQIDVIPTIYNLFDIKYDSRTIMGKDILSSYDGLSIFANRSWVSDKGKYFSSSKEFIPNKDIVVDDEYVKNMNIKVNNIINISKMIIENNYYKYIVLKEEGSSEQITE